MNRLSNIGTNVLKFKHYNSSYLCKPGQLKTVELHISEQCNSTIKDWHRWRLAGYHNEMEQQVMTDQQILI